MPANRELPMIQPWELRERVLMLLLFRVNMPFHGLTFTLLVFLVLVSLPGAPCLNYWIGQEEAPQGFLTGDIVTV